jgi:hypothetical protein
MIFLVLYIFSALALLIDICHDKINNPSRVTGSPEDLTLTDLFAAIFASLFWPVYLAMRIKYWADDFVIIKSRKGK